jgi:mxaJ protein
MNPTDAPRRGRMRTMALAAALALTLPSAGWAQPEAARFELAFCAPVAAWPMSSRERPGFDNAIAELLAEELGAEATFLWTNFDDVGIRDTLHSGLCDVAIGIGEGVAEVLSTVPYLKTPYVFVARSDRDLDVESLDDPRLAELTIGTYQTGIPSIALRNRGLDGSLREYAATLRPTGLDPHTPILDAVLAGEVDLGIVYGPVAGARALEEEGRLSLRAVTPELDFGATILQMSRIWTIGVRTHDDALRDRLNLALAARWDDVVAILDDFGVPQLPLSRPRDIEANPDATRVGVIHAARTPASLTNAAVGDDARLGAAVADNAVALRERREAPFVLLKAHAPTLASVERAALRLVLVEGVDALVGGYDGPEAALLARIATDHGVVFFNVGAEDDALRDPACYPTTLHVAPSGRMLVEGIARSLLAPSSHRVFVVAERGTETEPLVEALEESVARHGGTWAGSALVEPGQFVFFPVFDQARAADADALVLLMAPDAQELFLSQVGASDRGVAIHGWSTVRGQSRPYLQRYLQVAPFAGAAPRVAAWDPALPTAINETFAARTSAPMEPTAWTTYAAILAAFEAAEAGVLHDAEALVAYLTDPGTTLDLGKSTPVQFRAADGQLLQELYLVGPAAGATWGRTATDRIAFGEVLATLPADATAPAPRPAPEACGQP